MLWLTTADVFQVVGACVSPFIGVAARVAALGSDHGSGCRGCQHSQRRSFRVCSRSWPLLYGQGFAKAAAMLVGSIDSYDASHVRPTPAGIVNGPVIALWLVLARSALSQGQHGPPSRLDGVR